jgi:hypothetical protein
MKQSLMKLWMIAAVCLGISMVQAGFCQETSSLEVNDSAVCLNVENRACVDAKEEFSADVGKLYCFTRITGAKDDTEITHVWYYGEIERFRITLPIRSTSYRTYSNKQIQPHEVGGWHVDILGPDGRLLKTVSFKIAP